MFYDKPIDSVPNPPLINDMSTIGHNQRLNQNRGRSAIIQTSFYPATVVYWNQYHKLSLTRPACVLSKQLWSSNTLHISNKMVLYLLTFLTVELSFLISLRM